METCRLNVRRRWKTTPNTFMSSATGRSTSATDTDDTDESMTHSWFAVPTTRASDLSGFSYRLFCRYRCLTSAVHAAAILQLCCHGEVELRVIGVLVVVIEHHGLWWCQPPGCSRWQTAEARAQTPAERRPRASRLVIDADPAWRTESGPRGTTGAAQTVCHGWLCRTPRTSPGWSGLWPACRWLPCSRCLEPRAVQSRWNVLGGMSTEWSRVTVGWLELAEIGRAQKMWTQTSQHKPLENLVDCSQIREWPVVRRRRTF